MSAGIVFNNGVALTATAAGTLGDVLTSQGSGSAPIFLPNGGGFATLLAYTPVNNSDSSYTVLLTDQYIGVDPSGGIVVLLFPDSPPTGQYWMVKDSTGYAATNNITITTVTGSDTFDGTTTVTILQNYGTAAVLFNGTSYEVN